MGAGAGAAKKDDDESLAEKDGQGQAPASQPQTVTVQVQPRRSSDQQEGFATSSGSRPVSPDRLDLRLGSVKSSQGDPVSRDPAIVRSAWSGEEDARIRQSITPRKSPRQSSGGGFRPGQRVTLKGLENARQLNGEEGVLVSWDAEGSRWVVRLRGGDEFRSRAANLEHMDKQSPRGGSMSPRSGGGRLSVQSGAPRHSAIGSAQSMQAAQQLGRAGERRVSTKKNAEDSNKELEGLLLQTNWSAIYQLFHQRFGISGLERLERGYVVKSAVEMTLSIVAKCFALLRSDPNGRLHCTPLHIAALQSSVEAAEVIVRDLPKLVEQTHRASHSALCPLHIAVLCGAQSIVELLLEGRADPNVRTLHDVCPLHLACTTSKELCQVLLAYSAEPMKRDVMGSTAMHYATSFKQHQVTEVLLAWHAGAERLAAEPDQKRVTPLHISCALFAGEDDMSSPLHLLANGAKLWQTDISGASARDVVPQGRENGLQQFFERAGDRPRDVAQQTLEERYLAENKGEAAGNLQASPEVSDDEGDSAEEADVPAKKLPEWKHANSERRVGSTSTESTRTDTTPSRSPELCAELDRLRKELEGSRAKGAELQQLQSELDLARQKITFLEQANLNHQKVNEDWQALCDSNRSQHQAQLAEIQKRHADDRAAWEDASSAQLAHAQFEAQQRLSREQEAAQKEVEVRLQEAESRLRATEEELAAARSELSQQKLGHTMGRSALAEAEQLREALSVAESARQDATAKIREFREAVLLLCAQKGIDQTPGVQTPAELLAPIANALERQSGDAEAKLKALQDCVAKQQEEMSSLRAAKAQAEDRCAQLAMQLQEAESLASAKALNLESELQRLQLENSEGASRLRAQAETATRRAEIAETLAAQAQPTIDDLREKWEEEQALRKRLHNQIQDMKGAIRVYCRFRPLVQRERGESLVLRKQDAMNVELARPAPHSDVKAFQFDSVFEGGSTQEDVFSDCRDLVQSAVDGYNVTIFAYGQTGAGKTHTMYGTAQDPGLAPRTIRLLFELINKERKKGTKTFKVKAYMIEVYKQDIVDLWTSEPQQKKSLEVKKDMGRGVMFVEGVTEIQVQSPQELETALAEGEKKRHTTATKMNSASSRSHLLLSIIVECNIQETEQVIYGKVTLCDLAGSERPKKSEVAGDALKEAIEINKSLSALGDVIEALTKGSKSVPYRNHKLTMLMQDSLGGSAKTLMFVNCSPAGSNTEETLMSLKWASRARQVTNDVKRNADSKEVARLKQVIAMMSQAQNAEEGGKISGGAAGNNVAEAMAAGVGRG